jgi:HSP20 family protein
MSTHSIAETNGLFSSVYTNFFKPWNPRFDSQDGARWGNVLNLPAVNIMESKEDYKIFMAVPGIKKECLHIAVEGDMLTVSAGTEQDTAQHEGKYTRKEYHYNSFSRSISLPEGVQLEKITAGYKNGELTLTLPKTEAVKKNTAKHIAVV